MGLFILFVDLNTFDMMTANSTNDMRTQGDMMSIFVLDIIYDVIYRVISDA
ncbi:hypothetical protein SAMN05428977_104813 [Nitrosomonas sp. Nm166]|nr:hypothetical protein SAMN05428977_104813 [Nitrosomonas sp. Nm166]